MIPCTVMIYENQDGEIQLGHGFQSDEQKLSSANKELLSFLIQSELDLFDFVDNFWTGYENQFFAIAAFREKKIDQNKTTLKQFVDGFAVDPIQALSNLFKEPVLECDVETLSAWQKRSIENTIESLFFWHKKRLYKPFLSHIL